MYEEVQFQDEIISTTLIFLFYCTKKFHLVQSLLIQYNIFILYICYILFIINIYNSVVFIVILYCVAMSHENVESASS